jgi:uncharacterized protein involved in exopolysaccharide biosynthesis
MKAHSQRSSSESIAQSIWTGERSVSEATIFVANTLRHIRRRISLIIYIVSVSIVSTILYAKSLRPDFIATTQVLLQPHFIINDGPEKLRQFYQLVLDSDQCETELRVLGSQKLLHKVFEAQNLADASEIRSGADGLWALIETQLGRFETLVQKESQSTEAFNAFLRRVRVRRLGLSYVIEISYRAHSAEQATKVVNAIASTYAAYRLRGVLAREQRRGFYLESRLSSLLEQIMAAEAGERLGIIPEYALFDSDVRLLGPANRPLGMAYPRMTPLMVMMGGLGLISGLLIILLSRGAPVRHMNQTAISAAIQGA